MIRHDLTLAYELPPGWLSPWIDGLTKGKAVARKCAACGRVSFVPQRVCDCGSDKGTWVELSGRVKILRRTSGTEGEHCLAQFEGADIACVARLRNFAPGITHGHLVPSAKDVPMLILEPASDEGSN